MVVKREGGFFSDFTEKLNVFLGKVEKPLSNITQNFKRVHIHVELPKVTDKEITVIINNEMVLIKATRGKQNTPEYTIFYRKIPLPAGLDIRKTHKRFSRGVLTLDIPYA
ncbi:MAG: Hsp20/alpha crystallin family protein [Nanoarchaeota archaeon]